MVPQASAARGRANLRRQIRKYGRPFELLNIRYNLWYHFHERKNVLEEGKKRENKKPGKSYTVQEMSDIS